MTRRAAAGDRGAASVARAFDIVERARRGEVLGDLTIVDAHAHMGLWHNFRVSRGDPEGMIGTMDACGIAMALCSHHMALAPDEEEGNRLAFGAAQRHPGRLRAYVVVNPNRSRSAVQREMKRWLRATPCGIKLHPSVHRASVLEDRFEPVWEFAEQHRLAVLSHTWEGCPYCSPKHFQDLAQRWPRVKFVLGHSGGSLGGVLESIEIAKRLRNVYLDLTGSQLFYGILERMVRAIGASRILFGTDHPFIDPRFQLGRVLFSRLPDSRKVKILGGNAVRLFRLRRMLSA